VRSTGDFGPPPGAPIRAVPTNWPRRRPTGGRDADHWTLARANETDVRKLTVVLGTQCRALPNGDFNHSAVLLLDGRGRIVGRTPQLSGADPAFVKLVKSTLAASNP